METIENRLKKLEGDLSSTIYLVPNGAQYEIDVQEMSDKENFTATCKSVIINGKSYTLYNKITFTFKLIDSKVDIVCCRHTGTVNIDFFKEDGDDCNEIIEKFHPGLLVQLYIKLKEMKYI